MANNNESLKISESRFYKPSGLTNWGEKYLNKISPFNPELLGGIESFLIRPKAIICRQIIFWHKGQTISVLGHFILFRKFY